MNRAPDQDSDFPYWLLLLAGVGLYLFWQVVANELYAQVLRTLVKGIGITIFVTVVSFTLASALGLALASMVVKDRPEWKTKKA